LPATIYAAARAGHNLDVIQVTPPAPHALHNGLDVAKAVREGKAQDRLPINDEASLTPVRVAAGRVGGERRRMLVG